jgi:probable DNA repair protein
MESSSPLPPEAADLLARGGTIVTGNQRAARTLRLAFDRQRLARGLTSWQPPRIHAWDTWTAQLWQQGLVAGAFARLLLNRTQELHLWRSIIAAGPQTNGLRSVDSLAALAADAWRLLCAHRGQSRLKTLGVSEDTRAFQHWAQEFQQRCASGLYLSQSEIEMALSAAVRAKTLPFLPSEIRLIGFDTRTPAQTFFLEALRSAGVAVADQNDPPLAQHLYLAAAPDLDGELSAAALWLRSTLEVNPKARIAVIHPDVASERAGIDRAFRKVLAPELQNITANTADGPFEFSLGVPLIAKPMVAVAVKLLRWAAAPLPLEEISRLLLSPYFTTDPSERLQRAEFDAFELRTSRLLRPEADLLTVVRRIDRFQNRSPERSASLPSLLAQLRALHRASARILTSSESQPRSKSHVDWADNIRELLQAVGWASAGRDDSIEFQTRRKWESALDELATLDFEGARVSFTDALEQLEGILERTLFAPESRDAPIQIMSPQEAAGSRFDALCFLRADDLSWPASTGLNPLLGWGLQHDLLMPGSDPHRDFEAAGRVTRRLAASADTVVFSYACETANGQQRLSPLVAAFDLEPLAPMTFTPADASEGLESVDDSGFIPLANPSVRGGSGVLKAQAQCGFRAFAEKRLWSTPLQVLEPGLDAMESGNIVHHVMANFWNRLGTQDALRALSLQERREHLDRAIDAALLRASQSALSPWDAAYLDMQRERLHRLINPWLEMELARPRFAVKATEQKFEDSRIGPLTLTVRVDRIDTVLDETGVPIGDVILDYKTSDAKPAHWLGERPDDPQLPLYAVLSPPGSLAGVGFVRLRPGKSMGLQGFDEAGALLAKPAKSDFASLEERVDDWHRVLVALAEDFAAGDARVRPKTYPDTCKFCEQRPLCRLNPASLEERAEDAEELEEAHG